MKSRWSGPFVITEVTPYGAIEVKDEKTNNTFLTNGKRPKHYFGGDMAPPKTAASPLKRKARFYDRRFASPIAENRYNRLFSQSTIGIEKRGLELDPEGDLDRSMIDTVDVLHWADFINHLTTAGMLSCVQEFYANFANKDADERVFVQGKRLEEEFNYDEIGNNLRRTAEFGSNPWQKDSKGQYNNLLLSNLSVTARAWLHLISCRLLPASYRVEVTKDRALLINCRITKQPIDVAQIIIHTMH
ncbi:uncharacterized protein G2W53_022327 [Senna tora]|uniref:Putative plant transposon protein domain-containing protein n=1 Tax=Senna tora TaxID=362788 RepID=A0A834TL16_9FABA|nr:uncharacterized protein G2W53_022327 [Senna tora]